MADRVVVILHLGMAPGTQPSDADFWWRECFQPLIGAAHHTPNVRMGLVLAGEIVEEFEQRRPEGIEWLRGLVDKGQVELVGTALHEPVLSAVPERDAIGQIHAHATLVKRVFGVRPTGCWLPHGVWDPCVPRIIAQAGMAYTFVEDRLVASVVPEGESTSGVYRAEREGNVVAVFATDSRVREAAPEASVRQVLGHLERNAKRGNSLQVVALQANRFSNKRDQSWLATWLHGLGQVETGLRTQLPSDAVREGPTRRRIYLTSGAPRDQQVPWERCLLRYEESNRLHKRMVRVSQLVERLGSMVKDGDAGGYRPDPSQLVQANRYLYRAQAAPVFMHGPHPGIYDPRLRQLAWRDLLRAERVAMDAMRIDERVIVETTDVDCDGHDDIVLRTPGVVAVVDRVHSAGLIELSIPAIARNLVDTLTRKEEPYHAQLGGIEGDDFVTEDAPTRAADGLDDEATLGSVDKKWLEAVEMRELTRALAFDKQPRVSFVEHLIGPDVTVHDLQRGTFKPLAKGLREVPWTLVSAERHGEDSVRALLYGDGTIEEPGTEGHEIRVHKRYTVYREPMIDVRIEVLNRSHAPLRTRLALELDLAPAGSGDALFLVAGKERRSATLVGDLGEREAVSLEAHDLALHLTCKRAARVWHYPIETVHQDGARLVKGHQGVCVVLVWPIELFAEEKIRFEVRLAAEV